MKTNLHITKPNNLYKNPFSFIGTVHIFDVQLILPIYAPL